MHGKGNERNFETASKRDAEEQRRLAEEEATKSDKDKVRVTLSECVNSSKKMCKQRKLRPKGTRIRNDKGKPKDQK